MPNFDAERRIIAQQIRVRLREIKETVYSQRQPIGKIEHCVTGTGKGPDQAPKTGWKPFRVNDRWGGFDQTTWFRMKARIPASMKGHRVLALLRPGGESLAYVNGRSFQGLDNNRDELYLAEKAKGGENFTIALESVPSVRFDEHHYFQYADLVVMHPLVWDFYWDGQIALDVCNQLPENFSPRRQLLDLLNGAVKSVDLQHKDTPAYEASIKKAQRMLRAGLKQFATSDGVGKLILTGQSHIDTAWLWPLRETRRKCARTFSTVLDLMDRYPEFVFMASQPAQLEWMKQHYPDIYARIKQRVKEGRWEPIGGMYVECDCNVPSGESMVRQFLYGNRFFRREFGVHTRTTWLPDTFGDSWALPQILKKAQLDMFVTTKISWSEFTQFPHSFFQWEGPDGTRVPCLMPPLNYNGMVCVTDVAKQWELFNQKDRVEELPFPFGFGDGGGGPTMTMIETGKRLENIVGIPKCEFGRMQDSLDRMTEQCDVGTLPVWNGELYLELHRGCQTTQARTKRNNRKCELLLRDAELLGSLALIHGGRYDQRQLAEAWKIVLVNQFHDILPGSSITEVYSVADEDYARACSLATAARDDAAGYLAGLVEARGEGMPIVVFNTLPWVRSGVVSLKDAPSGDDWAILDVRGEPVAVQRVSKTDALFEASDLPPLGYAAFSLVNGKRGPEPDSALRAGPKGMENEYLRVRFDAHGRLTSVFDKEAKREVLAEGQRGNALQIFDDRPGRNDAWDIDFNFDETQWEPGPAESVKVLETGPLRCVVRFVRKTERSTITQDVTLYAHAPRLDFVTHVDWREKRALLKVAFPVNVRSSRATYEIQFAAIERSTHDNTAFDRARFEVTGHKWADLSEGDYGVSLLNDCKYGYDIKGNVMRLSLLRSPVEPDPYADEGAHEFTYSLYPHAWSWRNGTVQQAYELNVPLLAVRPFKSAGRIPSAGAFASVDRDHVIIDTVKRCEESDDLIVRLYEAHGQRGDATLTFGRKPKKVTECDLMEEKDQAVKTKGNEIRFYIGPYEIRTFKVRF